MTRDGEHALTGRFSKANKTPGVCEAGGFVCLSVSMSPGGPEADVRRPSAITAGARSPDDADTEEWKKPPTEA
jgi:hypothetical protein